MLRVGLYQSYHIFFSSDNLHFRHNHLISPPNLFPLLMPVGVDFLRNLDDTITDLLSNINNQHFQE